MNNKSMAILAGDKRYVNNEIIILATITFVWLNAFPVQVFYDDRAKNHDTHHLFSYSEK